MVTNNYSFEKYFRIAPHKVDSSNESAPDDILDNRRLWEANEAQSHYRT